MRNNKKEIFKLIKGGSKYKLVVKDIRGQLYISFTNDPLHH